MANVFPLPTNVPEAVSTGYQRQNTMLYMQMAGHLSIGLSNMDNSSAPKVLLGSVFEINGGLSRVTADESISGSPLEGRNYIYAVPNTGGASFQYLATNPAWDSIKGGWYFGNSRALAKFYYSSSGPVYGGKVILDGYNAMQMINLPFEAWSGGTLWIAAPVNQVNAATLAAGSYRFEMRAGNGGNGGIDVNGNSPGAGAAGESLTGIFKLLQTTTIYYALGGDGNNGGNGGTGVTSHIYGGGGGGGASGGSAFIDLGHNLLYLCNGGSGGGGAGTFAGTFKSGYGGGGAGGIGAAGGGGGGGGGSGGAHGNGGAGFTYDGTTNGGGNGSGSISNYGRNGNNGYSGESSFISGGPGGTGGISSTGENVATAIHKYPRKIQFQGGGGGGGGTTASGKGYEAYGAGGAGGSGLKGYSSGYLNIYRMG